MSHILVRQKNKKQENLDMAIFFCFSFSRKLLWEKKAGSWAWALLPCLSCLLPPAPCLPCLPWLSPASPPTWRPLSKSHQNFCSPRNICSPPLGRCPREFFSLEIFLPHPPWPSREGGGYFEWIRYRAEINGNKRRESRAAKQAAAVLFLSLYYAVPMSTSSG